MKMAGLLQSLSSLPTLEPCTMSAGLIKAASTGSQDFSKLAAQPDVLMAVIDLLTSASPSFQAQSPHTISFEGHVGQKLWQCSLRYLRHGVSTRELRPITNQYQNAALALEIIRSGVQVQSVQHLSVLVEAKQLTNPRSLSNFQHQSRRRARLALQ